MRLRLIGILGATLAGAAGTAVTAPAATTATHPAIVAGSVAGPSGGADPAHRFCGDPGGDSGDGGGQSGGNA